MAGWASFVQAIYPDVRPSYACTVCLVNVWSRHGGCRQSVTHTLRRSGLGRGAQGVHGLAGGEGLFFYVPTPPLSCFGNLLPYASKCWFWVHWSRSSWWCFCNAVSTAGVQKSCLLYSWRAKLKCSGKLSDTVLLNRDFIGNVCCCLYKLTYCNLVNKLIQFFVLLPSSGQLQRTGVWVLKNNRW